MKFSIEIDCEADAFADEAGDVTPDSARPELARILRALSLRFETEGDAPDLCGLIRDINGQDAGTFIAEA